MSEKIVTLNEEVIKGQLKELVRGSVEEKASKKSDCVNKLKKGTEVVVLFTIGNDNSDDGWCYIAWWETEKNSRAGRYKTGYIMRRYLTNTSKMPIYSYDKLSAFGDTTLKYDSVGCEVYNMQLVLYLCGYYTDLKECDGIYAGRTESALRLFQEKYIVPIDDDDDPVDGLAGPRTKEAMDYVLRNNEEMMQFFMQHMAVIPNG